LGRDESVGRKLKYVPRRSEWLKGHKGPVPRVTAAQRYGTFCLILNTALINASPYRGRLDLYLDEENFNIEVRFCKKGALRLIHNSKSVASINLKGFLRVNSLGHEDIEGRYYARKEPWGFVLLYQTRESIKVGKRQAKLCFRVSAYEKELWTRLAGELPLAAWVRSAVGRYIEDYRAEET
jgi:hypothetical protein